MLVSKSDDSGWGSPLSLMPQQAVTLLDLQEIRLLHSSVCLSPLKHSGLFQSRDGNLWRDKLALINLCKDPLFLSLCNRKK